MDWNSLYLLELIVMRMSGFLLVNPLFGRTTVPGIVKAGVTLAFSVFVWGAEDAAVTAPGTVVELVVRLLLELCVGLILSFVMQLFTFGQCNLCLGPAVFKIHAQGNDCILFFFYFSLHIRLFFDLNFSSSYFFSFILLPSYFERFQIYFLFWSNPIAFNSFLNGLIVCPHIKFAFFNKWEYLIILLCERGCKIPCPHHIHIIFV